MNRCFTLDIPNSDNNKKGRQNYTNQIKSNQILFIWRLSYFKSSTKCLTEAKNNNDIQHTNPPTPINTQRDTETNRHTHAHTHARTHKHTSSDPLHLSNRDMAGHPDLRQGKSHLGGPTTLRGLPGHDHRELHHRDSPDPGRQEAPHQGAESSSHPGQSSPQDSTPDSEPKAAPSVEGPHEETLELKTEKLKQ